MYRPTALEHLNTQYRPCVKCGDPTRNGMCINCRIDESRPRLSDLAPAFEAAQLQNEEDAERFGGLS
jgi:hypothetical protein